MPSEHPTRLSYRPRSVEATGGEGVGRILARYALPFVAGPVAGAGLALLVQTVISDAPPNLLLAAIAAALAGGLVGVAFGRTLRRERRVPPTMEVAIHSDPEPTVWCRVKLGPGAWVERVRAELVVARDETGSGPRPRTDIALGDDGLERLWSAEQLLAANDDDEYIGELPLPEPGQLPLPSGRVGAPGRVYWELSVTVMRPDNARLEMAACEIDVTEAT